MGNLNENWDGIDRSRRSLLVERHYGRAESMMVVIPPKSLYDQFFARLKGRGPHFLFNRIKAERAIEEVFSSSVGRSGNASSILDRAESHYMNIMGIREVSEDLSSGTAGAYRFERMNNPRRAGQSHGNKTEEAQYALRVLKDGARVGSIIPILGLRGTVGYEVEDGSGRSVGRFLASESGGLGKALRRAKAHFTG